MWKLSLGVLTCGSVPPRLPVLLFSVSSSTTVGIICPQQCSVWKNLRTVSHLKKIKYGLIKYLCWMHPSRPTPTKPCNKKVLIFSLIWIKPCRRLLGPNRLSPYKQNEYVVFFYRRKLDFMALGNDFLVYQFLLNISH